MYMVPILPPLMTFDEYLKMQQRQYRMAQWALVIRVLKPCLSFTVRHIVVLCHEQIRTVPSDLLYSMTSSNALHIFLQQFDCRCFCFTLVLPFRSFNNSLMCFKVICCSNISRYNLVDTLVTCRKATFIFKLKGFPLLCSI